MQVRRAPWTAFYRPRSQNAPRPRVANLPRGWTPGRHDPSADAGLPSGSRTQPRLVHATSGCEAVAACSGAGERGTRARQSPATRDHNEGFDGGVSIADNLHEPLHATAQRLVAMRQTFAPQMWQSGKRLRTVPANLSRPNLPNLLILKASSGNCLRSPTQGGDSASADALAEPAQCRLGAGPSRARP